MSATKAKVSGVFNANKGMGRKRLCPTCGVWFYDGSAVGQDLETIECPSGHSHSAYDFLKLRQVRSDHDSSTYTRRAAPAPAVEAVVTDVMEDTEELSTDAEIGIEAPPADQEEDTDQ